MAGEEDRGGKADERSERICEPVEVIDVAYKRRVVAGAGGHESRRTGDSQGICDGTTQAIEQGQTVV
jgi:hypothetical protein